MGLTLVELMVVMVVVGIVLAVSVPKFARFMRSTQLQGATNTLMGDLDYAHSLATMRRKTYQIAFAGATYTISQVAPPANILTRSMPSGMVCTAGGPATFFSWGLSVPVAVTVCGIGDSTTVLVAANGSLSHD